MTVLSKFLSMYLGCKIVSYNCYEIGHTWNPSCIGASKHVLFASLKESCRIYASWYLIVTLLRKRNLKKIQWKRLCVDILRSTFFLTSNSFFFIYFLCVIRRICGCWVMLNAGFTNGVIASFISILIERKSRRGLLALYLTNLASEVAFRMVANRGLIRPLAHGETVIFSLALAGYMSLLKMGELAPQVAVPLRLVFSIPSEEEKFLWSPLCRFPSVIRSLLEWIRSYFGKHPTCPHVNSCVSRGVEGFVRNFTLAFFPSLIFRLATLWAIYLKKPSAVRSAFTISSFLDVPLFLGFLPLLFSVSTCGLRRLIGNDGAFVNAIGGAVAGLAMLCSPNSTISTYLIWKVLDIVYFKLAAKGLVPHWKNFDIFLFALSTGFVLYASIAEPHTIRPTYWRFLLRLTDNKILFVNRRLFYEHGFDWIPKYYNFSPVLDPVHTSVNPAFLTLPNRNRD